MRNKSWRTTQHKSTLTVNGGVYLQVAAHQEQQESERAFISEDQWVRKSVFFDWTSLSFQPSIASGSENLQAFSF